LSLWLQGGPGGPSTPAALGENGPCYVASNSKDTFLNPWSWNNEVNMLYIDQPVQTGFSYDTLINGTIDEAFLPYVVTPLSPSSPPPELNSTVLLGTFPSQNPMSTANTTSTAALAAWHFMQIWIKEYATSKCPFLSVSTVELTQLSRFPKYKPPQNKFSIWSQSYGGHYGPAFSHFFTEQNQQISARTIHSSVVPLHIDTVGIINGCIDILTQMPSYPQMAYDNTYGLQFINETQYDAAMSHFPACKSQVEACRSLKAANDPAGLGNIEAVNQACSSAYYYCLRAMSGAVESQVSC
jgi:carboxypeptidase D